MFSGYPLWPIVVVAVDRLAIGDWWVYRVLCRSWDNPCSHGMTSTLSADFAASGVADGPDAVRDAVAEALAGLTRSASIVLVFPPATLGPEAAVEQATAACLLYTSPSPRDRS